MCLRHGKALKLTAGGGVCYITADDPVFVDQHRGQNRFLGAGIVFHFIHIAHYLFAGELAQIIALTLLQRVVPLKHLVGFRRNQHLAGFLGGGNNLPAEALQKFHPSVVVGYLLIRRRNGLPAAAQQVDAHNQNQHNSSDNQQYFFEIDLCGHNDHNTIPPAACHDWMA